MADQPKKPAKQPPADIASKSKSGGVAADTLTFEQAVERLESIIRRIESGEIGLEQSIREYEHGVSLLKRCRAILEQAEQRVEELTTPKSGASEGDEEAPF